MKHFSFIALITFLFFNVDCSDQGNSQKPYLSTKDNPFFTQGNQPIDFALLGRRSAPEACLAGRRGASLYRVAAW